MDRKYLEDKKLKEIQEQKEDSRSGKSLLSEDDFKNLRDSEYSPSPDRLIEDKLSHLHSIYKELLYIEDTKRIDIVLAVALSRKLEGIPIWLILVGASGDMKSVQLNAINDEHTTVIHNLTSKTLVNGYKDKLKYPDLAPELDGKLIVISDMAQILKLPPIEKAELWGQLRDLYDGFAGKMSGQGARNKYENLKVTLLAGSTPTIDAQILVHQDLGTRELIYRTSGNKEKQGVMWKCFRNEEEEISIKEKLKEVTTNFIKNTEIKRNIIPDHILEKIMKISTYITYMRASAEVDQYTNTLRNDVYPEEPTRISKQLKRIYICLKSLSKNYPDERALEILWHLGKSSAFPLRIKVFNLLLQTINQLSSSQVAEKLKIGKGTAQRELQIIWNLGLVECEKVETKYPDKFYDYWKVNQKHPFVKEMLEELIPSEKI